MVRILQPQRRLQARFWLSLSERWSITRFGGVALGITGLIAIAQPPATANVQDYEYCAGTLLNAKIEPPSAADSCARDLHPQDLGSCVASINQRTPIVATDALSACSRVRRPLDLANCVVNIDQQTIVPKKLDEATRKSVLSNALDTCRRSLLPLRYAECVIGLNNKVDLPPLSLMGTCIDASDRPSDLLPSFIR